MKKFLLVFIGIAIGLGTYAGRDDSAPTQQEIDNELQKLKNNMVLVEGGTFGMGVAAHETTVASFYISKYEVTQGLWRAVMGKLGYFDGSTRDDQLPLENRSWDACQQFISKLNEMTGEEYYMPTEAEWEFAARGGNKSQGYIYAGSNNLEEVAEWPATGKSRVGTKKPNELGLYDMTGNLAEWVADGESDELKAATRGGSYESPKDLLQVTCRSTGFYKSTSSYLIGLRLAKKATQQPAKRRPFFISYNKGGEEQQATVNGIRFIPSQYGKEAYAWQPADDEWQSYTSLAADGFDIQNVRSISRTRIELTESKGEELQQALEEEAQSGNADVNAIVAALKENSNMADAQTDGTNIIVREEGDSVYTIYPMVQFNDPFTIEESKAFTARLCEETAKPHKASTNNEKKIAIFNYYQGIDQRAGQNSIVKGLYDLFESYNYHVDLYDNKDKQFTHDNVKKVVNDAYNNDTYAAVFIFTHGFSHTDGGVNWQGHTHSYYVTPEEYDKDNMQSDKIDEHYYKVLGLEFGKNYYNKAFRVDELNVGKNCLLYVGSCYAFNQTTILPQVPWVGWSGVNTLAQAHAAIVSSLMLTYRKTLGEAVNSIWKTEAGGTLQMNTAKASGITYSNAAMPLDKTYVNFFKVEIDNFQTANKLLMSNGRFTELPISGRLTGNDTDFSFELEPLQDNGSTPSWEIPVEGNKFSTSLRLLSKLRGIYQLQAFYYTDKKKKNKRYIHLTNPVYLACSDKFQENDAIVLKPAKDSKIVMTTANPVGTTMHFVYTYSDDIWFDMNNNGVRDPGEWDDDTHSEGDLLSFYPQVQSQTFTIYGNLKERFDCGENVSNNVNRLTEIDMSEYYGDLEYFLCPHNELTKLVLPKSISLKSIEAGDNQLQEVDASELPFLESLSLYYNKLTSVKLPESESLTYLDVQGRLYSKTLKSIDLSMVPNLKWLRCQNIGLETLDVSQNKELRELLCDGNSLTKLNLAANQKLLILGCNYNQLDKDELESIYRQLPDITNVTDLSDLMWKEGFRMLRANGNPGFYEADQSIATKKGWEFEDKWTGYSRRSRRTPLGNGGTNSK